MQRSLLLMVLAAALLAGCVNATPLPPAPAATQAPAPAPQPTSPPSTAAAQRTAVAPAAASPAPTVRPAATRAAGTTAISPASAGAATATRPAATTAPLPAATSISTVRPAPAASPAPGLITLPTPQAPVNPYKPETKYVLQDEQVVGAYVVRLWHDTAFDFPSGLDVGTISAAGRPQIVITETSAIGLLNGNDLTGEGLPEIVIERFSGGAHCCFGTVVYQAGPTLTKILDLESGNCAGSFQDLDKNGVYEFVTCDDSFAYTYCAYAVSPKVRVIYEYKAGEGFRRRSPNWVGQYAQDIAEHTNLAQAGKPGDMGEPDHSNKCSVLPLTLDYLYSGQTTKAWDALKTYYKGSDLPAFQAEIDATVRKSPMFVTP